MKILITLQLFCLGYFASAQGYLHNNGKIKIFEDGQMGLYCHLVNDGEFDQNFGLIGFYGDSELSITGAFKPEFYDMEVFLNADLILEQGLTITNHYNFISGKVLTPRNASRINLSFTENAFYGGESDNTLVDGYAGIFHKDEFTFPIGDTDGLRVLKIASTENNEVAKAAYFREDPNSPSIFENAFPTTMMSEGLEAVGTEEFWDLDSSVPSTVNLQWDESSRMSKLIDAIANLVVVGWHGERGSWENLGRTFVSGNLNDGNITSALFIPDDYSVLSFGYISSPEKFIPQNQLISINGDGTNDRLIFEGLEQYPHNELNIYNRHGVLVYSKINYADEFVGQSNRASAIRRNANLEAGVYFYVITLSEENISHQGYLYIAN